MSHELGCSAGVGQTCTCASIRTERPRVRTYDALYVNGRCVLCDTPAHHEAAEFHAARHLETGECVVQIDFRKEPPTACVLVTADVPLADATGISVFEHDGDTWDRTDDNAQHLRDAYAKARALNRETKRRLARAAKEAK